MAYCPLCGASVSSSITGKAAQKLGSTSWNRHLTASHPHDKLGDIHPVPKNPFPKPKVVDLTAPMFDEHTGIGSSES